MEAKRESGLTAKQERYASLLARGYTQSAAYREAYSANGMKDKSVYQEASRLARDPQITARVNELLEAAKISDVDDARRAFHDLLSDLENARRDRNWTAVSALTRLRLQFHGLLRDRVVYETPEQAMSDEELIASIAQGDERKADLLRQIVGCDGFA